ncbi:MAG: hypothetical protein COU51_00325 [Parcubacteria group bacterium CG10_big_fil_rev_8_21_14_0_10_36_14]|nr:MAG: hypothetical protein COU51_00325 [Parcubacteria group bacterium CG10_big_fil_rev_8_21_14_0_10_36_14]
MRKKVCFFLLMLMLFLPAFFDPEYDVYDHCENGCFIQANNCFSTCSSDDIDLYYCLRDCERDWLDCAGDC